MDRKFRGWLQVRLLKRRRQEVKARRGSSEKKTEFGGQAEDLISVNNHLTRIAKGNFL